MRFRGLRRLLGRVSLCIDLIGVLNKLVEVKELSMKLDMEATRLCSFWWMNI